MNLVNGIRHWFIGKPMLHRISVRLHQQWLETIRHGDDHDLQPLSEASDIVDCLLFGEPLPARWVKREEDGLPL